MKRFFAFFVLAFLFLPFAAEAATLSVSPASGTYSVGQRVIVNVIVSSDVSMNAASGVLSFPTDLFSVEYVNKGSVLNFWVTEPSYSNASGRVNFEGVSLSGFQGSNGSVLTVALRAKKTGAATIAFESGQVLANDGQGTDVTQGLRSATYTLEAAVTPPTRPAPEPQPEPEPVPTPEPQKPAVTNVLGAPTIRLGLRDGNDAVIGESKNPKANVVLSFVAVSGSKVYITGTADAEGSFELLVPAALKNGPYAVTATMILDDGRQTETSDPLTIQVGGIASLLNWEFASYVLTALLLILGAFVGYLLKRGTFGKPIRGNAVVRKEIREAADVLHRSFTLLRQDLSEHTRQSPKKGPEGEKTDILAIRKDLDDAEHVIEKEIDDIDSATAGKNR
ncbi:cohesin domain-containing protein [Patescibacteria group bacterium]|nr:cohesin domain-containing protein [Patescibacteria group bacterium]